MPFPFLLCTFLYESPVSLLSLPVEMSAVCPPRNGTYPSVVPSCATTASLPHKSHGAGIRSRCCQCPGTAPTHLSSGFDQFSIVFSSAGTSVSTDDLPSLGVKGLGGVGGAKAHPHPSSRLPPPHPTPPPPPPLLRPLCPPLPPS